MNDYEILNTIGTNVKVEELFATKLRVKIIDLLAKHREINITYLVKESRSNHGEVAKHIFFLKKINLVEEKYFGRIRIIRLKTETFLGKIIEDFFKLFDKS
ncbi:MAG: hypothetical protein ACTSYF_08140 [Promethearchaeota archaeon]